MKAFIAALAVCIGCGVAGLSALVMIGIAVAAGVAIGIVAGGITYAVSKPSDKLDRPNLSAVGNNQTIQ